MIFRPLPERILPLLRHATVAALLAATGLAQAQDAPVHDFSCPPAARTLTAEEARTIQRDAVDRGFMWRLERDGRTSVLYGTLQAAPAAWTYPGPRVMQALRDSDVLALELDPLDPEIQRRTEVAMAPHPQQQLPGLLALRLRSQLRVACLPLGDSETPVAPEVQAARLLAMAGRRDGLDPAYSTIAALAGVARTIDKPVVSLESPDVQLALLIGNPRRGEAIIDSMLWQIEDGTARPTLRRLATDWSEGRLEDLEKYRQWCDCMKTEDDQALARMLIDERNAGLAARIEALHAGGKRVFAALGSLHMIGPAGLPARLEARGFRVERVVFPPPPPPAPASAGRAGKR